MKGTGVKYLLQRIAQLEGDKALLMEELQTMKEEMEVILKEVKEHGDDRKGRTVGKTEGSSRPKAL